MYLLPVTALCCKEAPAEFAPSTSVVESARALSLCQDHYHSDTDQAVPRLPVFCVHDMQWQKMSRIWPDAVSSAAGCVACWYTRHKATAGRRKATVRKVESRHAPVAAAAAVLESV
jgi:hypothetical protein